MQSLIKQLRFFLSSLNIVSFHYKRNETRVLSPETECTSHESPNDLSFRILGCVQILEKHQNGLQTG